MAILGIDYGDSRIGIAKCEKSIAGGVATLHVKGMNDAVTKTLAEIAKYNPEKIIIGLPLNMDGSEGFRAEKTRRFAALLSESCNIPIIFEDERLTTSQVYTLMNITDYKSSKRKNNIDNMSAELILQAYIDKKAAE